MPVKQAMTNSGYGPRWRHGGYAGGRELPEHYVWRSMLARCNNPKDRSYPHYGGRGVKVCERWAKFDAFLADLGRRPTPGHSIERLDVNGHYTPENCIWTTAQVQQRNKRGTKLWLDPRTNDARPMVGWAEELGISKELAHWRWKNWGTFMKGRQWQLQSPK